MSRVFDDRLCELGEGPLWHPERAQLFWFDILNRRLLSRIGENTHSWGFDRYASAAGWTGRDSLLIATETGLIDFCLQSGTSREIVAIEADRAETRSNDGRADPQGGFWIGTMGKRAQTGIGAIYRYHKGTLRRLFDGLTIPNGISFAPDGRSACFSDTASARVMRVALDAEGWPIGAPELFLDLAPEGLNPDGAVFDAEGRLWMAQWGAGRVAVYDPQGTLLRAVEFDAPQTSCPCFGGADLTTLFVTTARENMAAEALTRAPASGKTFMMESGARGLPAPRVLLPETESKG